MNSVGWLLIAGAAYYLYTHGGLAALGPRAQLDTQLLQKLPGGSIIGIPIPPGWRVWRLADGSQVIIEPGAAVAFGGYVEATHNGMPVWFNEETGDIRSMLE